MPAWPGSTPGSSEQAGLPFTVIDKNPEVGGTWFENRYPGARVDTPSRGYTHIFGVDFAYPGPFCPQEENESYFNWVADHFGLREHIVQNRGHLGGLGRVTSVWDLRVGPDGERCGAPTW